MRCTGERTHSREDSDGLDAHPARFSFVASNAAQLYFAAALLFWHSKSVLGVRNFVVPVPADIFVSAKDRGCGLVACLGSCGALGWHIVADWSVPLSTERPAHILHSALGRTRARGRYYRGTGRHYLAR